MEPRRYNRLNYITTCRRKQQTSTLETVTAQPEPDKTNKGKGRTETNKHSGKWRAISNARLWCRHLDMATDEKRKRHLRKGKSTGQLVTLGFAVAGFTPASYQRRRLRRPSRKSNLVAGFALRCFQRLSDPDVDTRQCAWRHNRQTRGRSDTVLSY